MTAVLIFVACLIAVAGCGIAFFFARIVPRDERRIAAQLAADAEAERQISRDAARRGTAPEDCRHEDVAVDWSAEIEAMESGRDRTTPPETVQQTGQCRTCGAHVVRSGSHGSWSAWDLLAVPVDLPDADLDPAAPDPTAELGLTGEAGDRA